MLALGIEEDSENADGVLELGPGDRMLLYTDGANETRDPSGKLFGTARLDTILAEPGPAARLRDRLVEELTAHAGERLEQDDLTLVVIEAR